MRPMHGLLNPANASESSGGFKEGIVRIDSASFKVYQGKAGEGEASRSPVLVLSWQVTRLDEDSEPLTDGDGNPVVEEIIFSLGGKSLQHAHPGQADSYEDIENVIDLGVAINTEGPTLFVTNPTWRPDKKSALVNLQDSLRLKGMRPELLDRIWAPDFNGSSVYLKAVPSGQQIERMNPNTGRLEAQTFNYKVVDSIKSGLTTMPAKLAAVKKTKQSATATAANGKDADPAEVESRLKPIMDKIGEANAGKSMSKKSLAATVNRMLGEAGVPPLLVMPIMDKVREDAWLTANAAKFDYTFDAAANQVAFA